MTRTFFLQSLWIGVFAHPASWPVAFSDQPNFQRKVSVTWQGVELGDAADRVAGIAGASPWLDRRVDPHRELSVVATDRTMQELWKSVLSPDGLDAAFTESAFYIGPNRSAIALPSLLRQTEAQTGKSRQAWLKGRDLAVRRGQSPREALEQALATAGVRLTNPDDMPFDVLGGRELKRASLVEFVTLLLLGFDLRAELEDNGASLRVVPIDYDAIVAAKPTASAKKRRTAKRSGKRTEPEQLYTLRIANQPLRPVVEQLAGRLGLRVEWSASLQQQSDVLRQPVSCDVRKVDLEELLERILGPAGLSHAMQGDVVKIAPSE